MLSLQSQTFMCFSQALSQTILSQTHFSILFYSGPHSSVRCYTRNPAKDQENQLLCRHAAHFPLRSVLHPIWATSSSHDPPLYWLSCSLHLMSIILALRFNPASWSVLNLIHFPEHTSRCLLSWCLHLLKSNFFKEPNNLDTWAIHAYLPHQPGEGYLPPLTLILLHFCLWTDWTSQIKK